jgi:cob(I)alamin adenosyltransferase
VSEKPFQEPNIGLKKIYTKNGDAGDTRLVGGQVIGKDDLRLECCGTVDELNALVGIAALTGNGLSMREPRLGPLVGALRRIQHELFNLGSILATKSEDVGPKQPRVTDAEVAQLEREIDEANEGLPALKSFVLPGGSRLNVELHACRTVCRRAERITVALSRKEDVPAEAIRYLNRLSDAFFVWSRGANHVLKMDEVLWQPNEAASGQGG